MIHNEVKVRTRIGSDFQTFVLVDKCIAISNPPSLMGAYTNVVQYLKRPNRLLASFPGLFYGCGCFSIDFSICGVNRTHSKQCAAVSSHCGCISDAPQVWGRRARSGCLGFNMKCIDTNHGHSP
ncbi:hypothetical protein DPMN_016711 [Dreissena polymorpha]|uniref:Uncharacterized protein n=1 Tax=Dreissena polymorpha TaxID=45954 RepID=A0A9D4S6N5_DREPO|nr:hypothetical protein DPMN_016711 [Dreissena polymorpha]